YSGNILTIHCFFILKIHGNSIYFVAGVNIVDGKKEGRGAYTQNDGIIVLGTWVNDMKNGKMIIYFTNGSRFEGDYKNDKANGYGIITDENGAVISKGLYVNDVLIKNEAQ
ncbi:MAG: hypothetical protein JW982_02850, partial [Spirochaetes bacterium]|nr:hypothetical protein [Spirochaetota bacterium]